MRPDRRIGELETDIGVALRSCRCGGHQIGRDIDAYDRGFWPRGSQCQRQFSRTAADIDDAATRFIGNARQQLRGQRCEAAIRALPFRSPVAANAALPITLGCHDLQFPSCAPPLQRHYPV